jgi:arylsulfatase A-like enzyme
MDRSIGQLRDWLKQENLKDNTLLWYCGDNGTPGDGIVTSPYRGQKGNMYEGGIRVPGVIEWPARITEPATSNVNSVTSDILPTLCSLAGTAIPKRPLDGISLSPVIDGEMTERPGPIGFWAFSAGSDAKNRPYIDAKLQEGTTPLVKMMGDLFTRNFKNYHHPTIVGDDFAGSRVLLDNRYKLVVQSKRNGEAKSELFDLRDDPAETKNLADSKPKVVAAMNAKLRVWQQSVLKSLTTADYE